MHDYVMRLMRRQPELEPELTPEELYAQWFHEEQTPEDPSEVLPFHEGIRSGEVTEASRPPTPFPPSWRPFSPTPATSRPQPVAAPHDSESHSDDPRSPSNTSRSSELTTGDFAWMMEERREATRDENCTQ
jgi:hypothetical protein